MPGKEGVSVALPKKDKMYEFMMAELGGEQEVFQRYVKKAIGDIAYEDQTLEDLVKAAKAEGYEEQLWKLRLTDLANIVNPAPEAEEGADEGTVQPAKRRGGKRMTAEAKDALQKKVLEYIGANPWSQIASIATAIAYDSKKLGLHLRQLKTEGKLKSEGKLTKMRYALTDEKTKPPKE